MNEFCSRLNQLLVNEKSINTQLSGSTGIIVLVSKERLVIANVGDSRCILVKESKREIHCRYLNRELKPTLDLEKKRILEEGGEIRPFKRKPLFSCFKD